MKAPKERWYLAPPSLSLFRHSFAINLANRREKNISGVEGRGGEERGGEGLGWHDLCLKKRDLSQIPDSSRAAFRVASLAHPTNHANGERGEGRGEPEKAAPRGVGCCVSTLNAAKMHLTEDETFTQHSISSIELDFSQSKSLDTE